MSVRPLTIALSPGFPSTLVDRVRAVAPHLRVVRLSSVEDIPPEAADAEVLAWWDQSQEALRRLRVSLPRLRWVQSPVAGIGDQRLHTLLGPDVLLTGAAGVYADLVAEHALALMLALYRELPTLLEQQRHAVWRALPARTLAGDTLGVVGAGGIGRAAARMARALGMRTIGVKRTPVPVPELDLLLPLERLPELLGASDVVLVAAPSTPESQRLIGTAALQAMRRSAVLINVARGPLVSTDDLVSALHNGSIAGAGLDVTDPEPLPADHPLWRAPHVIITPHQANPGALSVVPAVARFCENLQRYLDDAPLLAVVDPERGY